MSASDCHIAGRRAGRQAPCRESVLRTGRLAENRLARWRRRQGELVLREIEPDAQYGAVSETPFARQGARAELRNPSGISCHPREPRHDVFPPQRQEPSIQRQPARMRRTVRAFPVELAGGKGCRIVRVRYRGLLPPQGEGWDGGGLRRGIGKARELRELAPPPVA